MNRKYIIVADDSIKGFDEEIAKLEREWGVEEIEPSEDCISRQAVLDYAKDTCLDLDKYEDTEVFCDEIKALPSVTPTSEDIKEAYLKGYDYGVKDWFKSKTQPNDDCIRELIREFDNKHPALFADYMREFNNHPIAEIIEYMWDMHDLLEDIKYRLPDDGGGEDEAETR